MAYEDYEGSEYDGAPIFLYHFYQGVTTPVTLARFTSDLSAASYDGETWESRAISHSDIVISGEIEKDTVRVALPLTDSFAKGVLQIGGVEDIIFVTIYRLHRGVNESRPIWRGRLASPSYNGVHIELLCEPIWTMQKRTGLLRSTQRTCPHAVYDHNCRAPLEGNSVEATIVSLSGSILEVAEALDERHTGGVAVSSSGEMRTIVEQDGSILTLSRRFEALESESTVILGYGCDHAIATCLTFINHANEDGTNAANFGGFPWMPTESKNPFGGSSLV